MGDALEHGANDVCSSGAACDAEQGAACAVVPLWCAETEQRGHVHDAVGSRNARSECVAVSW